MRRNFFSLALLVVFCAPCFLGGCGHVLEEGKSDPDSSPKTGSVAFTLVWVDSNSTSTSTVEEAPDPNTGSVSVSWRKKFNLPEYCELPQPADNEPHAILMVGEEQIFSGVFWKKSSNDFPDILKGDIKEIQLDFYTGLNWQGYEGSRTILATDFFKGTAEETIKSGIDYFIHATTYSEISGCCFQSEAHVFLLPNDNTQVLFSFRETGYVVIPCYIDNPPGIYYYGELYSAELKGSDSCCLWGPCQYNGHKEMHFGISYHYEKYDISSTSFELHLKAEDGLHILKISSFDPRDIIDHQRPIKLSAEEISTGTVQLGGKFEYEVTEIIIDSPSDGDVVFFPIQVLGITKGIDTLQVQVESGGSILDSSEIPAGGSFDTQWDALDGVKAGDEITITLSGGNRSVSVEVVIGFPISFDAIEDIVTTPTIVISGKASHGKLLNVELWQGGTLVWDAPKVVSDDGTFSIEAPLQGWCDPGDVLVKVLYNDNKGQMSQMTFFNSPAPIATPVITKIPLTSEECHIVNGNNQTIYKWEVAAAGGNISIKQMPKLQVSWQDLRVIQIGKLQLSDFRLFRRTEEITDFVWITNQEGLSLKEGANSIAEGDSVYIVIFNEETVYEGELVPYTLKATPSNFADGARVSLVMLADNITASTKRYVYCDEGGIWKLATNRHGEGAEQFNFIWSDRSDEHHTSLSFFSSPDWFNGRSVKNLPLSHVILSY